MSLGERIKNIRKSRGLTQGQLSAKANISRSYLADVERDRYNPSVDTLTTIATALNVSPSMLLNSEPEQNTDSMSVPDWATAKDKRDFKKMLEEDSPVLFDGVPIEGEARQRVMDILTGLFWEAKEKNKATYGKKKPSNNEPKE